MNRFFRAMLALALAAVAAPAVAEVVQHQLTAPGGQAANASLRVYGVAGQGVAGPVLGTTYRHDAGYIHLIRNYYLDAQVPVAIASFNARVSDRLVEVSWDIGAADGLVGFNMYRADGDAGAFHRLNNELLPAAGEFVYQDDTVQPGERYAYRLGAVDRDGEVVSYAAMVDIPAWRTELRQNYPNPFNPTTTIAYYLAAPERVRLTVYDISGAVVRTLVDATEAVGPHEVTWDTRNDHGDTVSSGVYFYRLVAGQNVFTKKMTLLK